jgi:hypothetical protein
MSIETRHSALRIAVERNANEYASSAQILAEAQAYHDFLLADQAKA